MSTNHSTLFSIVYPTRDRPEFIKAALTFLEASTEKNFEVVICDNPSEEQNSVKNICLASRLKNIVYVRAPHDCSMVENWNLALKYASGSYVGVFTDKMMVLPKTLAAVRSVLTETRPDIVSWGDAKWKPDSFSEYFGPGVLTQMETAPLTAYSAYDPQVELAGRVEAKVARENMSKRQYAIGKICFGMYSRHLVDNLINRFGTLFFPISPDYTSMVLALSTARTAVFLNTEGVVHVHTDFSNGGNFERSQEHAKSFLESVDAKRVRDKYVLVPNLDWSVENNLAADFAWALSESGSPLKLNKANWIQHIRNKIQASTFIDEASRKHFLLLVEQAALQEGLHGTTPTQSAKATNLLAAMRLRVSRSARRLVKVLLRLGPTCVERAVSDFYGARYNAERLKDPRLVRRRLDSLFCAVQ